MVDATEARKADTIPDIKPLDRYDFGKAKTRASVRWLLTKAFGSEDSFPADLRERLPGEQYGEGLSPALLRSLVSCELYCRAYPSLLQREHHAPSHTQSSCSSAPTDHGSLLQLLQQRGLHATHTHTHKPVTDVQLTSKPINMGAHLAVIDSLMALAAMETMGVVKMAKEADQFGDGASWENSLLFWINKLIQKLRERTEAEDVRKTEPCTALQPTQPACPTRWYWKLVPHAIAFCLKESGKKPPVIRYRKDKVQSKLSPTFPVISGVKDLSNGCAIAAAVHFYCPQILPLEDVCLKDTMTVADSLYNLQLVREFCDGSLKSCCPLVLEDLLYAPPLLRVNIMCFLSELLAVFEVQKPDFIKPLHSLDLTDASGLEDCTSPSSGSPFLFKQPLLPISSTTSPGAGTEGRGWRTKQMSRPLSAVAFSIPFPLDSDVDVVMGNPLFRSVSTDSLTMATNPAPYTPPEDLSKLIGQAPLGELPTIEEALQVIHTGRSVRSEPRQRPEGAPAGFYLHLPEARLSSSAPCHSGLMYRPIRGGSDSNGRRGGGARRMADSSRDDDSVLRDGSIDSDASEELSKSSTSNPGTPSNGPNGARMTSFAERRKKLPESPVTSRLQEEDEPLSPGMVSPVGTVEAQELGARLEEKRRIIEAQKRRIEAIFSKHRQRLGKSAFLKLQREQGEGGAKDRVGEEAESLSLEERLTRMEEELRKEEEQESEERKREKNSEDQGKEKDGLKGDEDGQGSVKAPPKLEKQVTFSVEAKKEPEKEQPLVEYNEAVSKLSSALQSLQRDMQRLTEQQQRLMGNKTALSPKTTLSRKTPPPSKAWIIPASPKSPKTPATPPHLSRESTCELSPCGSPSRRNDPKSPALSSPRKLHRATSKSPRRQQHRPCDLSFPPLTRALAPTQNVDTLPHLRRVSPSQCQVQTNSSLRLGGPQTPPEPALPAQATPVQDSTSDSGSSSEHTPLFSLELEVGPPPPPAGQYPVSKGVGSSSGAPSECSFESDMLLSAPLRQDEGDTDQEPLDIFSSDSMSDQTETESRTGVGLYVKPLSEEEMALKRALLLERQQRRAEEIRRKRENSRPCSTEDLRPSVTPPLSQSLPTHTLIGPPQVTPLTTPQTTPQATPPGTPQRRGAFTKAEYARRQQLRVMADLEKVLKQRPSQRSGRKTHLPTKTSSNTNSPRKDKAAGPPEGSQADSGLKLSGLMSPAHLSNQNGDKDWENGSNASSPASIPEYTGPKLFKEPSLKSNKFIIHNALSHCCLAGKVNESQKNKIMEEMDKSSANHFLILLRDANCQFRAIYTFGSQSDELQRLCGVGPRVISCSAMEAIYKYSSDRKQFTVLPSRTSDTLDPVEFKEFSAMYRRTGISFILFWMCEDFYTFNTS
ncbi:calmodulin-regulated spectrin-associated protein 3 isoform X2 [Brachyhypopomus gauderio]|uniref:calmodulin-regulated spectrin-associated protein 3 isoform X2 n=1 Tax=Brachyhypopomus gauderio TaxID=698409 RepID=UPI004041733A